MGACTEIDASTCIRSYELHENLPVIFHTWLTLFIPDYCSAESSSPAVLRTIDRSIDNPSNRITQITSTRLHALFVPNDNTSKGVEKPWNWATKKRVRTAAHAKPKRVAGEGIPREEEEEEEEVHKKHMSWIVCIFKSTNPVDGSYPDLLPRLRFL